MIKKDQKEKKKKTEVSTLIIIETIIAWTVKFSLLFLLIALGLDKLYALAIAIIVAGIIVMIRNRKMLITLVRNPMLIVKFIRNLCRSKKNKS